MLYFLKFQRDNQCLKARQQENRREKKTYFHYTVEMKHHILWQSLSILEASNG